LINDDGSYRFVTTPPLNDKKDYYHLAIRYKIDTEGNAAIDYVLIFSAKRRKPSGIPSNMLLRSNEKNSLRTAELKSETLNWEAFQTPERRLQ
jgi:hypothetical protein